MKQTEIGMIPDDWEVKKINTVTDIIGDGIHTTPIYSNAGDVYFINGNNIKNGQLIFSEETKKVSFHNALKYCFPLGNKTVLLSINGTIGNVALYENEKIILGKSAAYLNTNNLLNKYYLLYSLQSDIIQKQFENSITGSTIKNLGLSTIRNTFIPLPPTLSEQQKIAKALSDVDNVISTLEKLITKKKNLKQGTMQQLLTGKKRLPGFAPAVVEPVETPATKQTELGEIPADWEVKEIGKILKIGHGRDYKNLKDGNVPVYGTGGYMISVNQYLYDGDTVCIGRKGTIDKPFYHEGKIWTVDTLFYTYDFKSVLPKFLYYKFCLIDWLSMNEARGVPSLTSKNIEDVVIALPSMPEQTAIANVLSSMDKEIEALNTKLEKYRNLKTGMMQQLLTGKIRL